MEPTDTSHPDYYHRVVDCQWACPAHTDVPEYIRLIAQGRFTDAYMVNRESNVFPGILGRVCDRPGEPGGLMRTNIPSFRLPQRVLSEEIGMITGLGVDLRLNSPVTSLRALLAQGFDAVFVGSGAPHGKNLDLPGRDAAAANIHIGIA